MSNDKNKFPTYFVWAVWVPIIKNTHKYTKINALMQYCSQTTYKSRSDRSKSI